MKRNWRFWTIVVIVLFFIIGLVIAGTIFASKKRQLQADNNERKALAEQRIQNAQNPFVAGEKDSLYYSNLGQALELNGQYDKALEDYKIAQQVITPTEKEQGLSTYLAQARCYEKLGDKQNAKKYYQMEIDRLKSREDATDNAKVIKNIEDLRDKA